MKNYKFSVFFTGGMQELVYCGCHTDAVILACAERIKKGFHRECYLVQCVDTGESHGVTIHNPVTVNYHKV